MRVVSTNGVKIFSSERSLYGDSFNEVMGYPANQFTTQYWYPWYDNVGMDTWVLVGNPSATTAAAVDIYVGGVKRGSYSIPKGGQITPRFNLNTGPVRVVSTNGVKVFSSERVLYGDSFNEMMGYPSNKLTTQYWFPWAYNMGLSHLEDARVLTQRQGGDPNSWDDVMTRLPLLQKQSSFKDTRYGYAPGGQAFHFVKNIRHYMEILHWQDISENKPLPPLKIADYLPEILRGSELQAL